MRDQLRPHNRSQMEKAICDGLAYCCTYAFFRVNKRTGMVAARLGFTDRAVRYWKAQFRNGELGCEKRDCCMLKALRELGK